MLAISSTDCLVLADASTLKHVPSSLPQNCALTQAPTSAAWSPDNTSLFVSTATTISRYDSSGNLVKSVYTTSGDDASSISSLVVKDKGSTVIFGLGQQVHVLETHTGKITQTFPAHKTPVISLTLANDGSLLASTSASAVHVHNLSHGSHTVMRGLPTGVSLTVCAFHPHSRTRLLVGAGAQLLMYDTTRPSAPVKAIALGKEKSSLGEIVSIACSPFSKTLVAVACSGGTISLVDLEKEKALYRTFSLHVPLTSLVFSAEGATLWAGTENGKLLGQDLRALDKPPTSIIIDENGERIVAIAVQKKLKAGEATPKTSSTTTSKPLTQQDVNKTTGRRIATEAEKAPAKAKPVSPVSARIVSGKATPVKPRAASAASPRPVRARDAPKSPGARKPTTGGITKKVFSPPRSPVSRPAASAQGAKVDNLDVSVRIENLLNLPTSTNEFKENVKPAASGLETAAPITTSASSRTASGSKESAKPKSVPGSRVSSTSSRTRTASGSSTGTSSFATGSRRVSKSSTASTVPTSVPVSPISSIPPVPPLPDAHKRQVELQRPESPISSPDLPGIGPVTPMPVSKRKGKERMEGMGVLGLGTPQVDRWIQAGQQDVSDDEGEREGEGKRVGFADAEADFPDEDSVNARQDPAGPPAAEKRAFGPETALLVSPRRNIPGSSATWSAVSSPLRNLSNPSITNSPGSAAAATLLQTLLRDAMHEFREETRTEIVGLHLDMLRMGRGIRSELRSVVDEFRSEIEVLQEENRRLKEENELLRRGY